MLKLLRCLVAMLDQRACDRDMVRSLRGEPTEYVAPVSAQIAAHYDSRANFRKC